MENKREENERIGTDVAYKSYLVDMAGTSQNSSVFEHRNIRSDIIKVVDSYSNMVQFGNPIGDSMINTVSTEVDIYSNNVERINWIFCHPDKSQGLLVVL
ncbi:hypothetical protein NPIL_551751 [Nephila pilipes]|uniref:Uncharacterized protein n=1 Tax=Nephila pilipes TaxID=299642 RepID=A0A8X6Q6Y7_NEPPI|nr:hypothetical protein NPIL_551751 [Nephila pilipes]